jgi:hypothetical protein
MLHMISFSFLFLFYFFDWWVVNNDINGKSGGPPIYYAIKEGYSLPMFTFLLLYVALLLTLLLALLVLSPRPLFFLPLLIYPFLFPLLHLPSHRFSDMVWTLVFAGADLDCEIFVEGYPHSVWELCPTGDPETKKALLHFWEPSTHFRHPKEVREAIVWYEGEREGKGE